MSDYEVAQAFRVLERNSIDVCSLLKEVAQINPASFSNNIGRRFSLKFYYVCLFCNGHALSEKMIKHKEDCLHQRIKSLFPTPVTHNSQPETDERSESHA